MSSYGKIVRQLREQLEKADLWLDLLEEHHEESLDPAVIEEFREVVKELYSTLEQGEG